MSIEATHITIKNHVDSGAVNFQYNQKNSTFDVKKVTYNLDSPLAEGEILIQTLYLSCDPAQKGWLVSYDTYFPATPIGGDVPSRGVGKVLKSNNPKFKEGDYVEAVVGWTTHTILKHTGKYNVITKLDSTAFGGQIVKHISVFGSTGMTAYDAVFYQAKLAEGSGKDKVFCVTGAAGAVGSNIIMLLANVIGAKRIYAIAGGEKKCKFVESLGENIIGVDYKDPNFKENFAKLTKDGENEIDFLFEQVGGEILDLCVSHMKVFGTILSCGAISGYNDPTKGYFKNYSYVIIKRLRIIGFVVLDDYHRAPEAFGNMLKYFKSGKLNLDNYKETIVEVPYKDFANVPTIWNGLFSGKNTGKYVIKIID